MQPLKTMWSSPTWPNYGDSNWCELSWKQTHILSYSRTVYHSVYVTRKTDTEGSTCVYTWIICFMAEFMTANLFPSLPGMFGKTHFKQTLTDKQIGFEPKHKFKQKKCKDWPSQICLQPWTNVCLHLQYHILSKGHICFWHVLRVVCKCPISVWHIWGASILSL